MKSDTLEIESERYTLSWDEAFVSTQDVEWLISFLREHAEAGHVIRSGETLKVGWSVLRAEKAEDSILLMEPTWALPLEFQPGVSQCLWDLRLQRDVLEDVGLLSEAKFPSLADSVIVCSRAFEAPRNLIMDRARSEAGVSGWFIGCLGEDHDHDALSELNAVSLYEAVVRLEHAPVPFLGLPETWCAVVDGDTLVLLHEDQELELSERMQAAVQLYLGEVTRS